MNDVPASRTIVVERTMPHPPEKIWRALTSAELVGQWLMNNDFQPVVGHRFNFRAEMYNVTNHTLFGVASTAWGATNFGQVTTNANYNRRSAQLSARVEF